MCVYLMDVTLCCAALSCAVLRCPAMFCTAKEWWVEDRKNGKMEKKGKGGGGREWKV